MQNKIGGGLKAVAKATWDAKISDMFNMRTQAFKSWPIVNGKANGVLVGVLAEIANSRSIKFNVAEGSFSLAR